MAGGRTRRRRLGWAAALPLVLGLAACGPSHEEVQASVDGFSDEESAQVYRELYDLARHLLETYSGTHKVFYVGHWEGDWHLRWDYDRTRPLDPITVDGMTAV